MKLDKKTRTKLVFSLMLLLMLCTLIAVFKIFHIPSNEELIKIIRVYFEKYGYPVLFMSAYIETIPVIYLYYPGSSVILLAAAFSRQGTLNIVGVILITALALLIGYTINYFIGKHGWFKIFEKFGFGEMLENSKKKIEKHGDKWIWATYLHPNLGALTSTAYGILKMPFYKFFINSIFALLFWCAFWGILCYSSSGIVEGIINARWFLVGCGFIYVIFLITKILVKAKKPANSN